MVRVYEDCRPAQFGSSHNVILVSVTDHETGLTRHAHPLGCFYEPVFGGFPINSKSELFSRVHEVQVRKCLGERACQEMLSELVSPDPILYAAEQAKPSFLRR